MRVFLCNLKKNISKLEPKFVLEDFESNRGKVYSFINPYVYNKMRKKKNREIISRVDGFFVDGILLVKLLRLVKVNVKRNSFDNTTVGSLVFRFCEKYDKSVFFIGAKEDEISVSVKNITERYTDLRLSGYRSGYFCQNEKKEIIQKIVDSNSDIVVVGMGAVLQENFLIDLKSEGFRGIGFSCGGFLRQSAKGYEYFPDYIDRLHLRWIYRMFKEKGIMKRNLKTYPVFLWNFFNDLIRSND